MYTRLAATFGNSNIFKDVDNFRPGDNFRAKLAQCVKDTDLLLALIGPDWLTTVDKSGRRIDDPRDWVRIEVVAALEQDKVVMPVLFRDAEMPLAEDLPVALKPLADRQAFSVSSDRVDQELDRLTVVIEKIVSDLEQEKAAAQHIQEAEAARQESARIARARDERQRAEEEATVEAARQEVLAARRKAEEEARAKAARQEVLRKERERDEKQRADLPKQNETMRPPTKGHKFVPKTSWSMSGRSKKDNSSFLGLLVATILFALFVVGISLPFENVSQRQIEVEQPETTPDQ